MRQMVLRLFEEKYVRVLRPLVRESNCDLSERLLALSDEMKRYPIDARDEVGFPRATCGQVDGERELSSIEEIVRFVDLFIDLADLLVSPERIRHFAMNLREGDSLLIFEEVANNARYVRVGAVLVSRAGGIYERCRQRNASRRERLSREGLDYDFVILNRKTGHVALNELDVLFAILFVETNRELDACGVLVL